MLGIPFELARSQSHFTLLVFLGVPCIGRTSASTSLMAQLTQAAILHQPKTSEHQVCQVVELYAETYPLNYLTIA